MGFLGRKMEEGASGIYRSLIYPFVRAATEIKTDSIMKQKSYLKRTVLYGKNYVGKGAILKDSMILHARQGVRKIARKICKG